MRESGLSTSGISRVTAEEHNGARTAQYVAVNDSTKSLVLAMADMDLISSYQYPEQHWRRTLDEAQAKCLVVDANLSADTIRSVLSVAGDAKKIFEPVSVAKSVRLFEGMKKLGVYPNHTVDLASPNIYELSAMFEAARERGYFHDAPDWTKVIDGFNMGGSGGGDYQAFFEGKLGSTSDEVKAAGIPQKVLHLLPYIPSIVVKLGDQGCLLAEIIAPDDERLVRPSKATKMPLYAKHQQSILTKGTPGDRSGGVGGVYMRYYPAAETVQDVVSVNGVGDTFLGVLAAGLARGIPVYRMIKISQSAAVMTLRSPEAVSPHLANLRMTAKENWLSCWFCGRPEFRS
jgi:pseudouridine-5'-phosphate glycosidase/pseudouridine kinase